MCADGEHDAVAWNVVRKDHAERLAQLAVDEGGFGNYSDKLVKINKRVTGCCSTCGRFARLEWWRRMPNAAS